jgi:hypothetical protein
MSNQKLLFGLLLPLFLATACTKDTAVTTTVQPRASACVTTKHHTQKLPEIVVCIKFSADTFPGWNPKAYDRQITTDSLAKGCFSNLPIGKHWLMAYGYDPDFRSDVIGQMQLNIKKIDENITTDLLVSETH